MELNHLNKLPNIGMNLAKTAQDYPILRDEEEFEVEGRLSQYLNTLISMFQNKIFNLFEKLLIFSNSFLKIGPNLKKYLQKLRKRQKILQLNKKVKASRKKRKSKTKC